MQALPTRIFLILFILFLINPSVLQAVTERRTALVIGNSAYSSSPLRNPVNDATDMATALKRSGFSVTLRKNANLREMMEAIEEFGNTLKKGGVGLFYYAGHGVQVSGANYLLPIGARINKEGDVRYEAVDVGRILNEMENANNGLNIVLLDACRDNPFAKSFRSATRGLAVVANAPTGTFISYSTGAGQVARDGTGKNSPYTSAVLQYMKEPGVSITDVFIKVRQKLRKETGQVPWELSSLEGKFFFFPGGTGKTAEAVKETADTPAVELDPQRREIEAERERLQKQRDLLEQREALAKQKEELAERERKLAIATQPSASVHQIKELDDKLRELEKEEQLLKEGGDKLAPRGRDLMRKELELQRELLVEKRKRLAVLDTRPFTTARKEINRDGRFIAYDNGTVLDIKSNLMWAAKDNGENINWRNAKSYCENYRGGGYNDWRMPTQDELAGLYDSSKARKTACGYNAGITELVDLTCDWVWASETRGSEAAAFWFSVGIQYWRPQVQHLQQYGYRTLPVRSAK